MKNLNRHITYLRGNILVIALLVCLYLCSLVVAGCSPSTQVKIPILSTPAPTPEYLQLFTPTGMISQSDYDESRSSNIVLARGIAISIWTNRMDIAEENKPWEIIRERVALYLDGEQVSNETLLGGPDGEKGGGLFRLSWAPRLSIGLHEVNIQFKTDGGKILDYSWQFVIEK